MVIGRSSLQRTKLGSKGEGCLSSADNDQSTCHMRCSTQTVVSNISAGVTASTLHVNHALTLLPARINKPGATFCML